MTTGSDSEPDHGVVGGLRQKAMTGVFWSAVEKWSVRLSSLVGFIILGNLLSPSQFGVVALASTFINILTSVSDAGFSAYLLQARTVTRTTTSTAFYTTAALVFAGALAGVARPISHAEDAPALARVLPALAVSLVVAGLSSVPAMLLRRALRFRELAMRNVAATVVSVAVAIGLALAGAGVWALVAQTLVRNAVALVVLWSTSDFRPRLAYDRREARAMTVYGVQSLLVQIGNQLRSQGEVFLIGSLAGTATLGYWTVAGRLVGVVVDVCVSVISSVAGPVFARLQGDSARLARALGTVTAMGALVLVPVMVLLSLVSRQMVPTVFGAHWAPAAAAASVLAMRSLALELSQFNGSVLLTTGHPSAELVTTTTLLVCQLGAVVPLSHHLVALALALLFCQSLSIPIRIVLVRRYFRVPLSTYARGAAVLLAGGVAAGAVVGAQYALGLPGYAYVALSVVLGGAVYLAMTLLVCRPLVLEAVEAARSMLVRRRRPAAAPV